MVQRLLAQGSIGRVNHSNQTRGADSALSVLNVYLSLDSAGARNSSSRMRESGIDTLAIWGDEPGYDQTDVVTAFEATCAAQTKDHAIISVRFRSVGQIVVDESGAAYTFVPRDAADIIEELLRKTRRGWKLAERSWGPRISPATARRSFHLTNPQALGRF